MENSLQTQPTRQPWMTPQVYDLKGQRTEAHATTLTPSEATGHNGTSATRFSGPTVS